MRDLRSELRRYRGELTGAAVEAAVTLPFRDGWMGFVVLLSASAGIWWLGFRHRNDVARAQATAAAHDVSQLVREIRDGIDPVPPAPVLNLVQS